MYVLKFVDGDAMNTGIDNLFLLSRAELLRLNHHRYNTMPDDLKPSVLGLAKLEVKLFGISA